MGVMTLESEQRKCTQTLLDSQFPTNNMRITIVTVRLLTHSIYVLEYLYVPSVVQAHGLNQ